MLSCFSSRLVAAETRQEILQDRPVSQALRQDNLISWEGLKIKTGWSREISRLVSAATRREEKLENIKRY